MYDLFCAKNLIWRSHFFLTPLANVLPFLWATQRHFSVFPQRTASAQQIVDKKSPRASSTWTNKHQSPNRLDKRGKKKTFFFLTGCSAVWLQNLLKRNVPTDFGYHSTTGASRYWLIVWQCERKLETRRFCFTRVRQRPRVANGARGLGLIFRQTDDVNWTEKETRHFKKKL